MIVYVTYGGPTYELTLFRINSVTVRLCKYKLFVLFLQNKYNHYINWYLISIQYMNVIYYYQTGCSFTTCHVLGHSSVTHLSSSITHLMHFIRCRIYSHGSVTPATSLVVTHPVWNSPHHFATCSQLTTLSPLTKWWWISTAAICFEFRSCITAWTYCLKHCSCSLSLTDRCCLNGVAQLCHLAWYC